MCVSEKKIIGVLQLWIYYTKDYKFARIAGLGIIETYKGNRFQAMLRLVRAMDGFCRYYNIKFVEASTKAIPRKIMKRYEFNPEPHRNIVRKVADSMFRLTHYVKRY